MVSHEFLKHQKQMQVVAFVAGIAGGHKVFFRFG
jgi:hypothetical protein